MSKPLFFTRRKNIARSDIAISLSEAENQTTRFSATLDLSSYKLPPEDKVTIEAYHNAYLERFDVATAAALADGVSFEMHGLEPGDRPLFRIKVIDATGKLLAAIDEVRPESDDISEASGSLLPILPKTRDQMRDQFWRLHFIEGEEMSPELWVNKDAPHIWTAFQMQDPLVIGLLMPEIFRQILARAVEDASSWTEEGLVGAWLQLGAELAGERFTEWDEEQEEEALRRRLEWVDEAVTQFVLKQRFFDRYFLQSNSDEGDANDA